MCFLQVSLHVMDCSRWGRRLVVLSLWFIPFLQPRKAYPYRLLRAPNRQPERALSTHASRRLSPYGNRRLRLLKQHFHLTSLYAPRQNPCIFLTESFKTPLGNTLSDFFHKMIVKIQIVHNCKTHTQHFSGF